LRERRGEREGWKEKRSCSWTRSRDLLDSLEFFRPWDTKELRSLQFFFTSYWEIQRPWIVFTWILMLTSDDCWLVGFWIHSTIKGALLLPVLQDKKQSLIHSTTKKSTTLLLWDIICFRIRSTTKEHYVVASR
jgi:hypothetical protein